MTTPRPDEQITRRRAQEAWAKLRRLQEPDVGSRHILAGDGGVSVNLAGSMLTIGRVSATGRPIIALNPTRRVLGMGQALEVLPMGETAPATWRVPPVRIADVYWVAGAVSGQTPGLFTPAHQFEGFGGGTDVAPDPLTPYQFHIASGYRIFPDGTFDRPFGGGATSAFGGLIVPGSDWDGFAIAALAPIPDGNLAMVSINAGAVHTEHYGFDVIFDPFGPPGNTDIIRWWNRYEYDELNVYSLEVTGPQVRNVRVRNIVNHEYYTYSPYFPGTGEVGVIDPPFPDDGTTFSSTHNSHVRYNPAIGHLFVCYAEASDYGFLLSFPWPAADPTTSVSLRPWPVGLGAHKIAFNADGVAYVSGADGSGARYIWQWDYIGGGVSVVAGDGSPLFPGGTFPVDGSPATSGDLGIIGGMDFDAAGNLLVACTSMHRVAEINVATGTIRTLAGFGLDAAATENLIEPLATAVFTDISSLQTDAAGRPYIGGGQVKRIGA